MCQKIGFAFIIGMYHLIGFGQFSTLDSENSSSIIVEGAEIGISTADGSTIGTYNHFPTGNSLVYGLKVKGSPVNGLTSIFKSGDFVNDKSISGVVGYKQVDQKAAKLCDKTDEAHAALKIKIDKIEEDVAKQVEQSIKKIKSIYRDDIPDEVESLIVRLNEWNNSESALDEVFVEAKQRFDGQQKMSSYSSIIKIIDDNLFENKFMDDLAAYSGLVDELNALEDLVSEADCIIDNRFILYLKGEFSSKSFQFDKGTQFNLDNRFIDSSLNHVRLDLGLTLRSKNSLLGVAFHAKGDNNLDELRSATLNFSQIDSLESGTILTERSFNGLSGEIESILSYGLDIDFLYLFENENGLIGAGSYMRIDLNNAGLTTGLSLNLYTGKNRTFAGSFFAELQDVLSTEDSYFDSFNFGIRTTFGLSTLFENFAE